MAQACKPVQGPSQIILKFSAKLDINLLKKLQACNGMDESEVNNYIKQAISPVKNLSICERDLQITGFEGPLDSIVQVHAILKHWLMKGLTCRQSTESSNCPRLDSVPADGHRTHFATGGSITDEVALNKCAQSPESDTAATDQALPRFEATPEAYYSLPLTHAAIGDLQNASATDAPLLASSTNSNSNSEKDMGVVDRPNRLCEDLCDVVVHTGNEDEQIQLNREGSKTLQPDGSLNVSLERSVDTTDESAISDLCHQMESVRISEPVSLLSTATGKQSKQAEVHASGAVTDDDCDGNVLPISCASSLPNPNDAELRKLEDLEKNHEAANRVNSDHESRRLPQKAAEYVVCLEKSSSADTDRKTLLYNRQNDVRCHFTPRCDVQHNADESKPSEAVKSSDVGSCSSSAVEQVVEDKAVNVKSDVVSASSLPKDPELEPVSPVSDDNQSMERKRGSGETVNHNVESPAGTSTNTEPDICVICMDEIETTNRKRLDCGHVFCAGCIDESFQKCQPRCPSCGKLFGILRGNQPRGTFAWREIGGLSLAGHERYNTIEITYTFPNGIQNESHPNPGQPYKGTTRQAYLPASPEGHEVCKLLKQAFDAKLVFTVDRSVTTGADNRVVWNNIHHKTELSGPFGYPDPTYLTRVKEELAAKGIVPPPSSTSGRK